MDNIVDNLSSQNLITFIQIKLKIIDIISQSYVEQSEAYYTLTRKRLTLKGVKKEVKPKSSSSLNSNTKECT